MCIRDRVGPLERIAIALFPGLVGIVLVEHRVLQAADLAHDGQGAVLQRDHLGEAARLEQAGHDDHVRSGVDQMRQLFVKTQFQMAVGAVVEVPLEVPEVLVGVCLLYTSRCV